MIDFDSLSNYKVQRSYLDNIIYLEYADGQGTWSVWTTTAYDPQNEPDPRMVYGSAGKDLIVRKEIIGSGNYTTKQEGVEAAKAHIRTLQEAVMEEELCVAA